MKPGDLIRGNVQYKNTLSDCLRISCWDVDQIGLVVEVQIDEDYWGSGCAKVYWFSHKKFEILPEEFLLLEVESP